MAFVVREEDETVSPPAEPAIDGVGFSNHHPRLVDTGHIAKEAQTLPFPQHDCNGFALCLCACLRRNYAVDEESGDVAAALDGQLESASFHPDVVQTSLAESDGESRDAAELPEKPAERTAATKDETYRLVVGVTRVRR